MHFSSFTESYKPVLGAEMFNPETKKSKLLGPLPIKEDFYSRVFPLNDNTILIVPGPEEGGKIQKYTISDNVSVIFRNEIFHHK